jgi:hypothetical protein
MATEILPLSALRDTGLLWLINRTTFHPLGLALALDVDPVTHEVTGYQILGDGTEPWRYRESDDDGGFFLAHETLRKLTDVEQASIPPGPKTHPQCSGCGERHPE